MYRKKYINSLFIEGLFICLYRKTIHNERYEFKFPYEQRRNSQG